MEGSATTDRRGMATESPRPTATVVTPAFNEVENLAILYDRLVATMDALAITWEWVIVDDHSTDGTFDVVRRLASADPRVRGVRFARNFGSHAALMCGLRRASGDFVVAIAGDLQDPPETIPALMAERDSGAQIVWAARENRLGESRTKIGFSRLYYFIMRKVVGLTETPADGADFFLIDRAVVDAFSEFTESNNSILALMTWMGFRQSIVTYDKQARLHGRSGWSLKKKLKLLVDSVTSFSYVPIRFMSYAGILVGICGFLYAVWVIINAVRGTPVEGWSSLMIVVLVIGGMQMVMMGVLGEYLWRALDESRKRPSYLIEDTTDPADSRTPAGGSSSP